MRNQTNWCLHCTHTTMYAIGNPLQDPHILAVARPDECAISILAEPVDQEGFRWMGKPAVHPEPVTDVIRDVVATEGQHRHRIATNNTYLPCSCCGRLR